MDSEDSPSAESGLDSTALWLFRFCRNAACRAGARWSDAEDIAQTVVERFLVDPTRVRRLKPWARVVVQRRLLRLWAASRQTVALDEARAVASPPEPRRRDLALLARGLARLSERDRDLIRLALGGASQAEIGARLGLPAERVGTYLARARGRAARAVRELSQPTAVPVGC